MGSQEFPSRVAATGKRCRLKERIISFFRGALVNQYININIAMVFKRHNMLKGEINYYTYEEVGNTKEEFVRINHAW